MRNKQIKLKYKAMQHLVEDLDCLVSLGFAEFVPDPKTGEYGYRFKEDGIKLLSNMNKETTQESSLYDKTKM